MSKKLECWDGVDRRRGVPPAPTFGALLVESEWRPTDRYLGKSEGWFRACGWVQDRRKAADEA